MTPDEKERVVKQLVATAEVMGHELKLATVMIMTDDLEEYGFEPVMRALTRCRKELTGKLTLKAILDVLAPAGGWLSANEAWSRALPAANERNTVVWTEQARRAWFVALPMIEAGDKVGARMAFIAAYDREVANAKNAGQRPQHEVSPGEDALLRDAAVKKAQAEGLLPPPEKTLALPPAVDEATMTTNRLRLKQLAAQLANKAEIQQ